MSSKVSHAIKARENAKDVFITPRDLALSHIKMIDSKPDEIWMDPCRYSAEGSYFSQFPNNDTVKVWCEITEGVSFFDCDEKVDIICCNPPYSILDKWFKKCIELKPRVFSMLIGIGNLTARRIDWAEKAGYGIKKMRMLKVQKWYGMSVIVVFEKGAESVMEIDRKVWYPDKEN